MTSCPTRRKFSFNAKNALGEQLTGALEVGKQKFAYVGINQHTYSKDHKNRYRYHF